MSTDLLRSLSRVLTAKDRNVYARMSELAVIQSKYGHIKCLKHLSFDRWLHQGYVVEKCSICCVRPVKKRTSENTNQKADLYQGHSGIRAISEFGTESKVMNNNRLFSESQTYF